MSAAHAVIVEAIQAADPSASIEDVKPPRIRTSSGKEYYFKLGSPKDADQFIGEAEALKEMHIAAPGLAPKIVAYGVLSGDGASRGATGGGGKPYFVSEYKHLGSLTEAAARKLGRRMATELHTYKSTHGFGFAVPTYCGNTRQDNGWFDTWEECYDALIRGLVTKLENQGGFDDLCRKTNLVRKKWVDCSNSTLANY